MPTFIHCLIPQALDRELTYCVPDEIKDSIRVGMRVTVPLKKGRAVAVVTRIGVPQPDFEAKEILETLDERPIYDERHLKFIRWVADYYLTSPGLVLRAALPSSLRQDPPKKRKRSAEIDPENAAYSAEPPPTLTAHQDKAVAAITAAVLERRYEAFLLHGVTGSGKTEVYLHAAAEALTAGYGSIILVPEIALSYQIVARFRGRFGNKVAVLHSRMTLSERRRAMEWASREPAIIVGARSAVFTPMPSLGLVVVDEEQEYAYKQEESPPLYHARECALMRAKITSCPAVLGSATPSLETAERARSNKVTLLSMPERIDRTPLPQVEIAPMGLEPRSSIIGARLAGQLRDTVEKGDQALLFINRRGFAPTVLCVSCGAVIKCRSCSTSLVLHTQEERMKCHWCGDASAVPRKCDRCGGGILRALGIGTQRVEAEMKQLMPRARVVRMDLDTTRKRQSHKELLELFAESDILIGTQMVAKGLDFPRLSLVGVILADVSLDLPDFRSAERTFQLITQVAGRAGRREKRGRVTIQTFVPDNPVIEAAAAQDYWRYFDTEAPLRKAFGYPPFGRLMRFKLTGAGTAQVGLFARRLAEIAAKHLPQGAAIIGPAPAMPEIVARRARWHFSVRAPLSANLWAAAKRILAAAQNVPGLSRLRITVDVDPLNVMS